MLHSVSSALPVSARGRSAVCAESTQMDGHAGVASLKRGTQIKTAMLKGQWICGESRHRGPENPNLKGREVMKKQPVTYWIYFCKERELQIILYGYYNKAFILLCHNFIVKNDF